jgi:hypothetical protein
MLEYGNVIWDKCTQNEANLLESVPFEASRIITGLRVNSSRCKLYIQTQMTMSINICHSLVHIPKINWRVIYISSSK